MPTSKTIKTSQSIDQSPQPNDTAEPIGAGKPIGRTMRDPTIANQRGVALTYANMVTLLKSRTPDGNDKRHPPLGCNTSECTIHPRDAFCWDQVEP